MSDITVRLRDGASVTFCDEDYDEDLSFVVDEDNTVNICTSEDDESYDVVAVFADGVWSYVVEEEIDVPTGVDVPDIWGIEPLNLAQPSPYQIGDEAREPGFSMDVGKASDPWSERPKLRCVGGQLDKQEFALQPTGYRPGYKMESSHKPMGFNVDSIELIWIHESLTDDEAATKERAEPA